MGFPDWNAVHSRFHTPLKLPQTMLVRRRLAILQYSVFMFALLAHSDSFYIMSSGRNTSPSSLALSDNSHSDDVTRPRQSQPRTNITVSVLQKKTMQQRRPHTNRRPRRYWANMTNFENELERFWIDRGLRHDFVLIPSESILYYYNRHDLRGAIASLGGREALAANNPNTRILPGRWSEAVKQYPQLLAHDPHLSKRKTPWSAPLDDEKPRWQHSANRREKGYWNITNVFKELYNYTYSYREQHGRPCAWMPRLSELAKHGRGDLKLAIQRFGGYESICRRAGMVPYKEWSYFEGQLCLLLELKDYCDIHQNGDYKRFPCVSDIERNGNKRLHSLIQYYGGRNFLALKLGMLPNGMDYVGVTDVISFGSFDLDLAVQLLLFIREDQLRKTPPRKHRVIAMPSANKLRERCENGEWIHERICEFGGYENVARRLGLAI